MASIGTLFGRFVEWRARARSQRLLLELDERLLKDIGLGRIEPAAGAEKPWWRS